MKSEDFQAWIGGEVTVHDTATAAPVQALAATLDHPCASAPGDPLPPLWHWLYFLAASPTAELGPDGHPAKGGFLPPVDLPRRMWAGSRLQFLAPVRIGQALTRRSVIQDVTVKDGRSGALCFVQVRHEVASGGQPCIVEEQDIVYRAAAAAAAVPATAPAQSPPAATWERQIHPSEVLLFRYSALTFNGHRIHYDRPYATGVEGYEGLVVHGPLIATLLLDLVRRALPQARIGRFHFKALRPLLDTAPFTVCACLDDPWTLQLWARDAQGHTVTSGTAVLAQASGEDLP
jgi:3-methylfumaryl-CoA hydratase